MPLNKLSQKSFVNGQYDRTAQNQESVSGGGVVASGLSYAKNILSSDKGELRKRLGTKFLKQLDGATVIVPFRNKEDDNILLFAQNKLDILEYKDGGVENFQQQTDTKVEKTWTSDTVDGYTVSVPARGTSGNGAYNMFQNPYYPPASGSENAAHPFVEGYEYLGDLGGGGVYPPNSFFVKLELPADGIVGKFSVIFATTHNEGAVPISSGYTGYTNAVIQYSDDNLTWVSAQTIISSVVGNTPYYTWRFKAINNGGTIGVDTTKVEQLIIYDVILNENVGNHRYWRVYFTNPVDSHDRLYSQKLNIQFYTRTLSSYSTISTDITNLKNIKYSQSGNDMKLVDGEHTPKTVALNAGYSYSNFTPSNPGAILTGATPSCVQYFQNRLWFGGFSAYPTTVIASKFNNINDFRYSTPAQTDDGLELKCNQLKSQISNLTGGQNILYCFSQDGISNIDGASNGLATNSNIEFVLKNRMPAGDATPAFKDDVMLYSSSDGTKLYGLDFDLLVNRFQVSDLAKYAKDITKAKVTELHYVNNESKLVYGLTEEGTMFALLYEKGQYQGFFPLDFGGTVYDIAPIKVGRNYKLLMVVFRDGNWYLEEKLDVGHYIDTSKPRMTAEEKKWATYDNLENNVALDCYKTYDESIGAESNLSSETLSTKANLYGYIGSSVMLGNKSNKDFTIVNIDEFVSGSTQTLYKWVAPSRTVKNSISWSKRRDSTRDSGSIYGFRDLKTDGTESGATYGYTTTEPDTGTQSFVYNVFTNVFESSSNWSGFYTRQPEKDTGGKYYWAGYNSNSYALTDSETPNVNDLFEIFASGNSYQRTIQQISYKAEPEDIKYTDSATPSVGDNVYNTWDTISGTVETVSGNTIVINGRTYTRDSDGDITRSGYNTYNVTVLAQRGDSVNFDTIYPEIERFTSTLPSVANIAIVADGRYFDMVEVQDHTVLLPTKCYKITYGIKYEAVAIIKIQNPYESLKNVAQVDISVINTTHLELGTEFSDTQNIEKIDDSSYYDLTRVTMNDTYRLVLSDTPETTKNLILRSNKGVPFTVIAIDMYINYSNLGGD
jgi:hypothetical protein